MLSNDERLPGGPAVSAASHFISSHLIKLVFVMVAIITQVVAGIELGRTVNFLFFDPNCKVCRVLQGNGDSLVSDRRCKHDTKPTHTSHFRTRFFLVWLKI